MQGHSIRRQEIGRPAVILSIMTEATLAFQGGSREHRNWRP